jgi:hypothetical protein
MQSVIPSVKANGLALDGSAIDLLVGTPDGIVDPLDKRRNRQKFEPEIDFSEFLQLEPDSKSELTEILWSDAEEFSCASDSNDSDADKAELTELIEDLEYLDIFENQDSEVEQERKVSDSVETEFKL